MFLSIIIISSFLFDKTIGFHSLPSVTSIDLIQSTAAAKRLLFHDATSSLSQSLTCNSSDDDVTTPRRHTGRRIGWMGRCRELVEYKQQHGDCRVPKRYAANPSLANWVSKQRSHYKRYQAEGQSCALNASRIQILNEIGFCWDVRRESQQQVWWDRLEELRVYTAEHPDVPLPLLAGGTSLRAWLDRQKRTADSLDPQQRAALHAVDPLWNMNQLEFTWELRYRELVAYKAQTGHCLVPISYPENPKLGHWVSTQRKQYKNMQRGKPSNLTQERITKLNAVGFAWDRWDQAFTMENLNVVE